MKLVRLVGNKSSSIVQDRLVDFADLDPTEKVGFKHLLVISATAIRVLESGLYVSVGKDHILGNRRRKSGNHASDCYVKRISDGLS